MVQHVNVPGVGQLAFPDDMSQDDMAAAIQRNYPQIHSPDSPHPDDSPFVKGIKDLGTEAGRVGVKAVTALPLMAMDMGVGARNLIGKATGTQSDFDYPSDDVNHALDRYLPAPGGKAGRASEIASTLIASLGMPGPSVPQAVKAGLTGADAVKATTLREAQQLDQPLVVPPNLTKNAPLLARVANGWGGKVETSALANARNQPSINAAAASDLGLPPTASLTTNAIKGVPGGKPGVITDAVAQGYAPLRNIGDIPVDAAHFKFAQSIGGMDRGASNIDPRLGNPVIAQIADALTPTAGKTNPLTLAKEAPSWASGDVVDAISALRAKAQDAFATGNNTVGKAYKQAAGGLESLIDRHLQGKGEDGAALLTAFRQARQTIAKGHDVLDALNPATGDVDAKLMGKALDDGALSGNLETLGKFGRAFGDVAGRSKGDPNPVTAFQANTAGAESPFGLAMKVGGNLLGRPLARNYALSAGVQRSLMQPKGKTLTQAALDAAHANPAAFAALYEDQNN